MRQRQQSYHRHSGRSLMHGTDVLKKQSLELQIRVRDTVMLNCVESRRVWFVPDAAGHETRLHGYRRATPWWTY